MPGFTIDGNDPLVVFEAVKEARERAVNGEGPTLIEAITYRFTAHSSDDDDQYRESDEIAEAKENDGITTFGQYLLEHSILTEERQKEISDEIDEIVNEATDYAESAAYPEPESALQFVYEHEGGE